MCILCCISSDVWAFDVRRSSNTNLKEDRGKQGPFANFVKGFSSHR